MKFIHLSTQGFVVYALGCDFTWLSITGVPSFRESWDFLKVLPEMTPATCLLSDMWLALLQFVTFDLTSC